MGHVIGIDLGTTNSCVAYLEGKEGRVIHNLEGMSTTPSVVSFTRSSEELIGNLALRQAITNPENTVFAVKRLMGKKFNSESVQEISQKIPYRLTGALNGDVMIDLSSKLISPQEISAMIIKYLKKCAESYFGEKVEETIITVPAHFNDHQRQATKDAAKIAGLRVLRVINEPTSACLAYGLNEKKSGNIAVYDIGGGTFDISILEVSEGVFNVLATNGDTFLGGEDFDARIVDWLIDRFQKKQKVDISEDKFALQRIKEAAEKAKKELSFTLETEINLPFITSYGSESKHLKETLSRRDFEELTKDLVQKTIPYIEEALSECGLNPENIDEVLLVGGQGRMPLIKKMTSDYFKKDSVENLNPDEVVAVGAAIQSGILEGEMKDLILLLDVTPLSLGIETENDTFSPIIPKNTTIPTKITTSFTTVENNQRRVRIHVLQGENPKASLNTSLAVFDLVGIESAPAGVPQIDVHFEIDGDGIVRVSAVDSATQRKQGVKVNPSSGLKQKEINKIIKREQAQNARVSEYEE
ncbi:molecular chaperone DnaK [bacterium]|nr:molecular chaperone DnaK [bacterium]